ncbi:MAG: apolipoprotein N-acyltransferase [Gemmatimonadetes bacterium]|uniref:Apolipoprotein N-acyltransferase n=1 Tax=Candidatus Kutchimonas denitrificans TaxID=3056748 RepID=A0AAE5C7X0_9BACT|nr:apolipoprotein N-acyltransferase [Gemmatimonadota bacterium]NIR73936.1 apolipoprotein N-acyltransferase [Candidatus Kutchimonas denitrificans]NIR99742.1 apolipoprotein N-acyltransferase [Gemmatimonadota bacterium]NIT65327.1 apolipoprotein N-acyltransferase [Gemmatimonadota bacterium]NIW73776.1 apolipoprotein N-acyltransferase [Gemmatimonadota bacterium]
MRHPVLPRGKELGLPIASGILLTLAFPPFHLLAPSFVALVPWLVFVGRAPETDEGSASVRRATFWMGIVYFGTLLYWLFTSLVFYTWLSLLGYLITVLILAGILAVVGWGVHRARVTHGVPFWVSVPVLWTAAEWVQGHLGDIAFPWLGLGNSLTGYPALVGFAELTGTRGVTFWLALVGGLLAEWWLDGLARRPLRRAAVLAAALAIPIGFSVARWYTLDVRPAARALVVQPNIPEDLKLDREEALDSSFTALDRLTRTELDAAPIVSLVVWPETALPTYPSAAPGWADWANGLARDYGVGLLYGLVEVEWYPDRTFDYYNAALFVDSRGSPVGTYRKHYLVPVVERVPFLPMSWMRDLRSRATREEWRLPAIGSVSAFLRYFGGFGRGVEEPVFTVDGAGFGVLICYESIFAPLSRTYRRNGADFLVNITNDAWYGREKPWWSRSSALYQHPSHLVMRAIENRMGVARSANTGISLFVDPHGRVSRTTPLFEAAARVATVQTTDTLTLYTRLGDWPGWLSAIAGFVGLGWLWVEKRRRRN